MKKFLISLLATATTLIPTAVDAREIVSHSTQEYFDEYVEWVRNNHKELGIQYEEFVAHFPKRDTPPSDSYMYENAQFEFVNDWRNDRYYYTESGDAYVCSIVDKKLGCYYDSTRNLRQAFLKTYRGEALMWEGTEVIGGKCSLLSYTLTAEKDRKFIIATSRVGGSMCE